MKKAILVISVLLALGVVQEVIYADFTFGEPINLGPMVNSPAQEAGQSLSADGLTLFFGSNLFGGNGRYDIYIATRATASESWGERVNLGTPINSPAHDFSPSISADGLELYFGSDRSGDYDLWVATACSHV